MFGALFAAHPEAAILGLTGSPWRLDSGSIVGDEPDSLFRVSLADVDARYLIQLGYLVPLATKAARGELDTSDVAIRNGDFASNELALLASERDAVDRVVAEGLALTASRRTVLWFAVAVEHATALRDELRRRGERAEVVTGETPQADRAAILDTFAGGNLRHVVNVAVLQAGYDCPPIGAVVMARPTCSPALRTQCAGRGLRLAPGKSDCLLIDVGGNWRRLGSPLRPRAPAKGRDRREGDHSGPHEWSCKHCLQVNEPTDSVCRGCGTPKPRRADPTLGRARIVGFDDLPLLDVEAVAVRLHEKPGKAPSLRVSYRADGRWFSECIAFTSDKPFARHKAREWWTRRFPGTRQPATAADALRLPMLRDRLRRMTAAIRVDESGEWPRIVWHELHVLAEAL